MISIEQVGVPPAADSLHSLCFPSHSLSGQPHTHSINCETYWAFEWTNEDPVSFNGLILCLTRRTLKLQLTVECISQLAQIQAGAIV